MATAAIVSLSGICFTDTHPTFGQWLQTDAADDDEKLKFLEQAIKDLGQPGNVEKFSNAMKELGVRAVKTDSIMSDLWSLLLKFEADHKGQYPGLHPFLEDWDTYVKNWAQNFRDSRNLAFQTGDDYEFYTSLLKGVGKITTKEQMEKLAADLKEFAKSKPIGVPVDLQNKFLDLRNNVADFHEKFNKYLDSQGATLTEQAKKLASLIDGLAAKIAGYNTQIENEVTRVDIASWWGPVAISLPGTPLATYAGQRQGDQNDFDGKRKELGNIEHDQTPFGVIRARFAGAAPDFKLLSESLGLLADTWNAFHNEAIDFATKFEKLETPTHLLTLFQRQIDLAIVVSDALSNGLRDYVESVTLGHNSR